MKNLFIKVDLPANMKMLYKGLIKKAVDLQNGWFAVILKNNLAILLYNGFQKMYYGAIKKIVKTADGKFMLVKKDGRKAIWDKEGQCLATFSKDTELYHNGWYRKSLNESLALYDDKGNCIGQNLRTAEVFSNGFFFMSVLNSKDGDIAGVYNNKKERLLFTNSSHVCVLRNGWFITEGTLYDNLGKEYLSPKLSPKLSFLLLTSIGAMMPFRK